MAILILTFPALIREQVLKVCADIAAKDKTFTYREVFDFVRVCPICGTILEYFSFDRWKCKSCNKLYWTNEGKLKTESANKVIIENSDKDTAHRRALWFKNKVHKAIHYEVV